MDTETYNAYQLARMADVVSPDSDASPGAAFLLHVAGLTDDLLSDNPGADIDTLSDSITEQADNAVPVYTHEKWQTFVDLCAYTEDVSEFGPITDMENAADLALYMIAERLIHAVIKDRRANGDEDDDEDNGLRY